MEDATDAIRLFPHLNPLGKPLVQDYLYTPLRKNYTNIQHKSSVLSVVVDWLKKFSYYLSTSVIEEAYAG